MSEIETGPLKEASPDDEHRAGPLQKTKAPPQQQRVKKTWREKRWERRRRRRFTEEVLGWILVPIILIAVYWAVKAGLNAMGTNLTSLIQGIKTAISGAGGGR
jgi:hypothetical protein